MADTDRTFAFGRFRLSPARRLLAADGAPLAVGSRAFDILLALVERRDRVVAKDELLQLVWPGRVVEEGNLSVHVAHLRRLLGSGVIATLPGRGYRFVAALGGDPAPAAAASPSGPPGPAPPAGADDAPGAPPAPGALPRAIGRLIGRAADVAAVAALLDEPRLVAIVGPGGIGKTRVAVAVAEAARAAYPDGAWLADLAA